MPWWGSLGNVHSTLHSKGSKIPSYSLHDKRHPLNGQSVTWRPQTPKTIHRSKRISPIWTSCTTQTIARTPFQKTPPLSYVVQIRWKVQKCRNHSPVTVLAALEANLAKSQHNEQTNVPCDHPQPAEFNLTKASISHLTKNNFLQQCAAIPYGFMNHEFPSRAQGKHTCWDFESLIHQHKLWVGA